MKIKTMLYTATSHGRHALLLEQNVKTHSDQVFIKFAIFTFAFSVDNHAHPTNTPPTN